MTTPKKILVAPLDWGLGHATRCIPIIKSLIAKGHEVLIAGSGPSLELLKREFPALRFLTLPSYNPRYPRGKGMVFAMTLQLPRFISAIRKEHEVIGQIISEHAIDVVISDNRYGCWSRTAYSVFITHQSNILMPRRFGWLSSWVRKANESMMNRFDRIWIPDFPGNQSMAGELVSFGKIAVGGAIDYVGTLSRFKRPSKREIRFNVVAVCSGPEPQRSLLEELLIRELEESKLTFLLVRGVMTDAPEKLCGENGLIVNFLTTEQLGHALADSDIVVCRSGYSSIMDLAALACKAVFIPTPGQTEQEYLAARLEEKRVAFYMQQDRFSLRIALQNSSEYTGFTGREDQDLLNNAIDKLLEDSDK
jgi:uncharacterized protein (TIGR00661 family)